ncbi:hypothetical protein F2P81_020901 [Scophthalmus maximus]|uniref:Uncharacterized protein n=1 Tax=Scophthalmus maximus TaxID=52904 RepID=A0A6A4S6H2_SCOMX|nr:hypothetical protein F2P81_020901 [Scophthalmus maximus]
MNQWIFTYPEQYPGPPRPCENTISHLLTLSPLVHFRSMEQESSWHVAKTGLTVYRLAYQEHQKAFTKSLRKARSQFYSNIINTSPGNSKQLFSTINHFLKPQTLSCTDTKEEQCNNFIIFFRKKVDTIRSLLSSSPALSVPTADPLPEIFQPLFPKISQREIEDIIRRMKPSTCNLDPFPTAMVKSNVCALSPLITQIINHSLQAGYVPSDLKTAVIRPLLKKTTLDPEILANYSMEYHSIATLITHSST